jgi:tRNA(Ile)-lysidine synthase
METLKEAVLELWQRLVAGRKVTKVVVAVSGGLDSQVLLSLLFDLSKDLDIELHVAHLDHQLRRQATMDACFVRLRAAELGLSCTSGKTDIRGQAHEQGLSLEEAARKARFIFLDEVAQKIGAQTIALGHHADDQAETVLLRLLRGSGSTGLGAMGEFRDKRYIRPLLSLAKEDLEAYAAERSLAFREDDSNLNLKFSRNRVRHKLIPQLKRDFNPGIVQVLERTAKVLKAEDECLNGFAQTALETVVCEERGGKLALAVPLFLDYHIAIQRRILRIILQRLFCSDTPFGFTLVNTILERVIQSKTCLWQFNPHLWGQRVRERFILRRGSSEPLEQAMQIPGSTRIPQRHCSLEAEWVRRDRFVDLKPQLGQWSTVVDVARFGAALVVRSPRPGDRFQPLGMRGHKKLGEFLIDAKWPRILRPDVLVVEGQEGIIWVVGGRPDEAYKVQPQSTELLHIQYRPLGQGTIIA